MFPTVRRRPGGRRLAVERTRASRRRIRWGVNQRTSPCYSSGKLPVVAYWRLAGGLGVELHLRGNRFPGGVGAVSGRGTSTSQTATAGVPFAFRYGLTHRVQLFVNASVGWANTELSAARRFARYFRGNYRLIYRVMDRRIDILTVFRGAQILRESDL